VLERGEVVGEPEELNTEGPHRLMERGEVVGEPEELDAEGPHRLIHPRHRAGAPHLSHLLTAVSYQGTQW
jgi:hypothetical protein